MMEIVLLVLVVTIVFAGPVVSRRLSRRSLSHMRLAGGTALIVLAALESAAPLLPRLVVAAAGAGAAIWGTWTMAAEHRSREA
jgi:hypothetical protein